MSYSGGGDLGYQVFAGINYELNKQWKLQSELRHGSISNIDLESESGDDMGEFTNIDYETTTVQIGVVYGF